MSGVTDFSFCDDEAKWRGSEVHKIIELADRKTLDVQSIPSDLRGYYAAHQKFNRETGFIPIEIECKVESGIGVRGRIDRAGIMKGKRTIIDFKTGTIDPAVALQLCLGGHLLEPGTWFHRYGVQLCSDGKYHIKEFALMSWHSDLATALACVRVAQWKIETGKAER